MRFLSLLILTFLSLSVFARTSDDDLTLKLAKLRKAQVKTVNYTLFFELNKGSDTFKGKTIITSHLYGNWRNFYFLFCILSGLPPSLV